MKKSDTYLCFYITIVVAILVFIFELPQVIRGLRRITQFDYYYILTKVLIISFFVYIICVDFRRRHHEDIEKKRKKLRSVE